MNIPMTTLTRQYKTIEKEIDRALKSALLSGAYILSDEVSAFEKEFAGFIGCRYGVGVGSGTDALTLALRALGFGPDDEVIVPANASPTVYGVAMAGVKIKLIDCAEDANLDSTKLARTITKRTKAIILVHLYGNPADIFGIQELLKDIHRTDIAVIEDCAQAHGGWIGGDEEARRRRSEETLLTRYIVTSSHQYLVTSSHRRIVTSVP